MPAVEVEHAWLIPLLVATLGGEGAWVDAEGKAEIRCHHHRLMKLRCPLAKYLVRVKLNVAVGEDEGAGSGMGGD